MSCETRPNKIAAIGQRLGIARLAGKRAFYLGLALTATGLAGALALAGWRARLKGALATRRPGEPGVSLGVEAPPVLSGRPAVTPTPPDELAGKRCGRCHASAQHKRGPWYVVEGQAYCQDCAQGAARAAGVDLAVRPPELPSNEPDGQAGAGTVARRSDARLEKGRAWVDLGYDQSGKPLRLPLDDGYLLVDERGQEIGLAVTPKVEFKRDKAGKIITGQDGRRAVVVQGDAWQLTHLASGRPIAGPFATAQAAQGLLASLPDLDWWRPLEEFSRPELEAIKRAGRTYLHRTPGAKPQPGRRGTRPWRYTWVQAEAPADGRGALPPLRAVETRLKQQTVEVVQGQEVYAVDDAYVVLTATGQPTGLGITPTMPADDRTPASPGWQLTHLASGEPLAGPFGNPAEAEALASILAPLDFNRTRSEFAPDEVAAVEETIRHYSEALEEAKSRMSAEAWP